MQGHEFRAHQISLSPSAWILLFHTGSPRLERFWLLSILVNAAVSEHYMQVRYYLSREQ